MLSSSGFNLSRRAAAVTNWWLFFAQEFLYRNLGHILFDKYFLLSDALVNN